MLINIKDGTQCQGPNIASCFIVKNITKYVQSMKPQNCLTIFFVRVQINKKQRWLYAPR